MLKSKSKLSTHLIALNRISSWKSAHMSQLPWKRENGSINNVVENKLANHDGQLIFAQLMEEKVSVTWEVLISAPDPPSLPLLNVMEAVKKGANNTEGREVAVPCSRLFLSLTQRNDTTVIS